MSLVNSFLRSRSALGYYTLTQRLLCFSTSVTCQKAKPVQEPLESTRGELEKKINEKFGSRLIGWNPRETNGGQPSVIYTGILSREIKSLKIFSFTTTAIGLTLQGHIMKSMQESSLLAKAGVFSFVGFFIFVTPILIHFMSKRYVTELSYDPQTDLYRSTTYSFFLRRKELQFKIDDVVVPEVPGIITTLYVKLGDKVMPLYLADFCFKDLKHFGRLMGYDKPLDFGITATDVDAEAKKRQESIESKRSESP